MINEHTVEFPQKQKIVLSWSPLLCPTHVSLHVSHTLKLSCVREHVSCDERDEQSVCDDDLEGRDGLNNIAARVTHVLVASSPEPPLLTARLTGKDLPHYAKIYSCKLI